MKLFLIRHGETVDNVAGLYAGVRDSALTNHGVEQAQRLGDYFAKENVVITHIFASPLSRAFKTAEAVRKAQVTSKNACNDDKKSLEIVKVPELIEQDFGFYEGKSFFARSDPKKSGREEHHAKHKNDLGFVDVESKESMAKRADAFLDDHLMPLLRAHQENDVRNIVIVSHGILLSHLWRRLLLRMSRKSLKIASEVTAAKGNIVLEHLGGWSNTGYLELSLKLAQVSNAPGSIAEAEAPPVEAHLSGIPTSTSPPVASEDALTAIVPAVVTAEQSNATSGSGRILQGWSTTILAIDSKQHLIGLKRQRGGIGRLAHDEGQKKLDGFFKRQKTS